MHTIPHDSLTLKELNRIFDFSESIICQSSKDGLLKSSNPAFQKILAYTDENSSSQNFIDLIHPKDIFLTSTHLESLSAGVSVQFSIRTKTGQDSYKLINWNCIQDSKSQDILYIGHEVSTIVFSEETLQKTIDRTDPESPLTFGHKIRTPMSAIIGFAQVLKSTELTEEQLIFVDAIASSSANLLQVINDVSGSNTIESNTISLEESAVNVPNFLNEISRTLQPIAAIKQLKFNITSCSDVPTWIISDPLRLNQIIVILANNALTYTERGYVNISCSLLEEDDDECYLEFKVSDSGIGIPKDRLKAVFPQFQQDKDYTERKYGGTGLRLSIVKELIDLLGGEIVVSSKSGEGTQFTVLIPFKIPHEIPEVEQEFAAPTPTLEHLRILLAEDNILNQMLLQSVMKKFKVDLTIVNDGQEAVDIMQEKEFDVVLMDLQMPTMDGYEATKIIIDDLKIQTPIIAMTALSLVGEKEKCFEIGMSDFISKPFKANDLINILEKYKISAKHEESTEKAPEQSTSFDLSNLILISGNDLDFVKETIDIAILTIPAFIDQIELTLASKDLQSLKKAMHKIKPIMIMFDHAKVRSMNAEIEQCKSYSEIESSVPKLLSLLKEFIAHLKTKF